MPSTITNEVNKVLKTYAQTQALIQNCVGANSRWERLIDQIVAPTEANKAMLQLANAYLQNQALIQADVNVNSVWEQFNISQKEMINDIFHHQPRHIQNHINITIINHDVDEKDSDYD